MTVAKQGTDIRIENLKGNQGLPHNALKGRADTIGVARDNLASIKEGRDIRALLLVIAVLQNRQAKVIGAHQHLVQREDPKLSYLPHR